VPRGGSSGVRGVRAAWAGTIRWNPSDVAGRAGVGWVRAAWAGTMRWNPSDGAFPAAAGINRRPEDLVAAESPSW